MDLALVHTLLVEGEVIPLAVDGMGGDDQAGRMENCKECALVSEVGCTVFDAHVKRSGSRFAEGPVLGVEIGGRSTETLEPLQQRHLARLACTWCTSSSRPTTTASRFKYPSARKDIQRRRDTTTTTSLLELNQLILLATRSRRLGLLNIQRTRNVDPGIPNFASLRLQDISRVVIETDHVLLDNRRVDDSGGR